MFLKGLYAVFQREIRIVSPMHMKCHACRIACVGMSLKIVFEEEPSILEQAVPWVHADIFVKVTLFYLWRITFVQEHYTHLRIHLSQLFWVHVAQYI